MACSVAVVPDRDLMHWGWKKEVRRQGRDLIVSQWERGHISCSQWELTAAISENLSICFII